MVAVKVMSNLLTEILDPPGRILLDAAGSRPAAAAAGVHSAL
jgi:hypothetical protein